jgi:sensor histidine kinase YesM
MILLSCTIIITNIIVGGGWVVRTIVVVVVVYLYNILGWSSFPSIHPIIHPSKFLIPEEEDDGTRRRKEEDEWLHQQFIQMLK